MIFEYISASTTL